MSHTLPLRRVALSCAALAMLWACNGSDGPTEPAPTPTLSITASPNSLSVEQGSAGVVTATVTRGGGFTGAVTIAAEGLPAGVTVASQSVASGSTSATLDFQVSPSTAAGTTTVTLRATGTGVQAATATVSLTVTPRPTGSFSLALGATAVSVEQGKSGTAGITIARQAPFTGAVALAVSGAPTGVTATLDPASVTGTTSTLTLAVSAGAATGASTITVTGTATGVESKSVTLQLTVTAQPTGGFALALTPATLSVERGKSGTASVAITRQSPFSGAVALTVSGAPTGVTATLEPASATGTASALNVAVSSDAVAGTSALTIAGTGEGVAGQSVTLELTVTDPPATGGFSLSLGASTLSVEQGKSGTATVTVARQSPFQGAVALAVTGAPTGVTVTADPASVTGTSSTLTVAVGENAAAGTTTLTVTGTGEGVAAQSVALALTVTPKATGGFSLSASPTSVSVQQGQNGTATVTVARTAPFTGAVALQVTGAPTGVTATFDPASVTGTSSTLTLAVGSGVAAGTSTLTITGSGTGVASQSVTLALTVTPKPAGTSYTWNFCPNPPVWFAVKDGDGAWAAVTPSGSSVTFSVSSSKVGVAWVTTTSSGSELNMRFATQSELGELSSGLCRGSRSVTGTVSGLGATDQAWVSMGTAAAVVVASTGTSFNLNNISDGTVDLFAARNAFSLQTFSFSTDKLFLQRGLNPSNGGAVAVDFNGANAFAPATHSLTATGLNGDAALVTMLYVTSGNSGVMTTETSYSAASTRSFPAVPADRQVSGDYHLLQLTTRPDGANNVLGSYRAASKYFQAPGDQTLVFGAALGTTTFTTASSAPYVRPRVQYTRQSEYNRYWYGAYQQTGRNVVFYITDDYQGSGDIDFTLPDFSGLAGWNNSWGLAAGAEVTYNFTTSGWDGAGSIAPATLAAGLAIKTATRSGKFNP